MTSPFNLTNVSLGAEKTDSVKSQPAQNELKEELKTSQNAVPAGPLSGAVPVECQLPISGAEGESKPPASAISGGHCKPPWSAVPCQAPWTYTGVQQQYTSSIPKAQRRLHAICTTKGTSRERCIPNGMGTTPQCRHKVLESAERHRTHLCPCTHSTCPRSLALCHHLPNKFIRRVMRRSPSLRLIRQFTRTRNLKIQYQICQFYRLSACSLVLVCWTSITELFLVVRRCLRLASQSIVASGTEKDQR